MALVLLVVLLVVVLVLMVPVLIFFTLFKFFGILVPFSGVARRFRLWNVDDLPREDGIEIDNLRVRHLRIR